MKLYSIPTGNFKLDGGAMFGFVPKTLWQKSYPADENNLCNWAMRCLLIEDGDKKILIDAGAGDKQDEKFTKFYYYNGDDTLMKSLAKYGFKPEAITDVIITHLHFDHVGGATKYNDDKSKVVLTFPNATYWIGEAQWNVAINPNKKEKPSYLKENILPIGESGKMKLIKEDTQIYPNLSVRLYYGHTDGQVIPFIKYNDTKVIFTGDLMPSSAHIPILYNMGYDNNPLVTIDEKGKLLNEAADKKYIFFFEHDVKTECCTVVNTEKGVKIDKVFKAEEI